MLKEHKIPYPITISIITITSVVTVLQFIHPEILSLLRRDPDALMTGEWWRIVTPLLVHADGLGQYIFNMICLALIGLATERVFGRGQFIMLYLAGGLLGEIAGYASWDPYGAGASVGFCGLLGGLYAVMLIEKVRTNPILCVVSLYITAGLISASFERSDLAVLLFVAVGVTLSVVIRRKDRDHLLNVISLIGGLLGAIPLLFLHDIHGAAILGGVCTGLILYCTQGLRGLQNKTYKGMRNDAKNINR